MMTEIKGDVGTQGGDFTGRDKQTMRAGDTFVGTSGEFPLWKLIEMDGKISALVIQMDDLPNRVGRLERLEVVVKPGPPPEVIVRPIAHDTVNLSVRVIVTIFLIALVAVLALVAWLVFLQVARV